MRAHLTFSSLLALALFGFASRPAQAQSSCTADTDCVKGWTCQVSGGTACGAPACAPGEKCDEQPIDCVAQEFKSCQPGPCSADSDCADGTVCYTHTETNCAPTACASGQECAAPSCEPKTESRCVPRYVLPCTTASDCGSGFTCEPAGEQCACSGSAGGSADSADGGKPLPPSEPSCICEPSKELRCHAAIVNCAADSDCTAGWSCVEVGATSDCATAAPEPNPGSGAKGGTDTPPPDCRPSAAIKQCMPPYYELAQGVKGVERDAAGIPTLGADDSNPGGANIPPSAESDTGNSTSSAGCSVGHGSGTGPAGLALLGVLGVFGALRRRRAS